MAVCLAAFAAPAQAGDVAQTPPSSKQNPDTSGNMPDFSVERRLRLHYEVSIGNYIPEFAHSGYSRALGTDLMLGFIYPNETYDLRLSTRWQSFEVGALGQSSDIFLSVNTFEILFRRGQYYFGPGVGLGLASQGAQVAAFTTNLIPVVSLAGGYDINRRWFAEARFQAASDPIYQSFSINLGYRF